MQNVYEIVRLIIVYAFPYRRNGAIFSEHTEQYNSTYRRWLRLSTNGLNPTIQTGVS